MRARSALLGAGTALIAAVTLAGPSAAAAPRGATCDPTSAASITAVLSSGGSVATFTVTNATPLCDALPIGAAVYLKDGPDFVVPQELVASGTDTITEGSKTITLTLPTSGTKPHCFTQVDAFTGPVLPAITDTDRYGDRLLAYQFGEVPVCGEVEAASSTTTTTTTTTTEPAAATLPSTTAPPEAASATTVRAGAVLGEQLTRPAPAPAAVAPAALARTGAPVDTGALVAGAATLLLLGLALVVTGAAKRRAVR